MASTVLPNNLMCGSYTVPWDGSSVARVQFVEEGFMRKAFHRTEAWTDLIYDVQKNFTEVLWSLA